MKTKGIVLKPAVMRIMPLLLLVSILGAPFAKVYATETVVGIESAEDVEAGNVFILSIYLENAIKTTGVGLDLIWDPLVLTLQEVILSDSAPAGTTLWEPKIDNDIGSLGIAITNTKSPNYITVIENTPILDLTFEAIGSPGDSTILHLENVELSDENFDPYYPDVVDGYVSIYMPEIISISVDPSDIDFGTIYEGNSGTSSVTITNDGTVEISVNATLGSEDPVGFYTDNLKMFEVGPGYVYVEEWNLVLQPTYEESVSLELTIPYPCPAGNKTAILVFWAETRAHAQPSISPTIGEPTTFFTIIDPQGRMTVAIRIMLTPEGESPENGLEVTDAWFSADGKTATGTIPPTAPIGQNYITVHAGPASDPPLFNALPFSVSA